MSSVEFVRVLRDIGYPKAEEFNPSDWDWLFELGGGAGAFLAWLCRSVTAQNVVSSAERAAYTRLKESEGVLEGTRLDEALASHQQQEDRLEEELQELNQQLEDQRKKLDSLRLARDQLCNENLAVSMELSRLGEVHTAARSARHHLHQRLLADQLAVTEAHGQLATAARQLTDQLTQSRAALLSQTPLDGVEAIEARVTEKLAEFSRCAFGGGQSAGEPDCSLLDLRPGRLPRLASHEQLAAQLTRLERVLPQAKRAQLLAEAESAGLAEAVQQARRLLTGAARLPACHPIPSGPEDHCSGPEDQFSHPEDHCSGPEDHCSGPEDQLSHPGGHCSGPEDHVCEPAQSATELELQARLPAACQRYVHGLLARACVGDHARKLARQQAALARQTEARAAAAHQLARLEWLRRAVQAESGAVATAGDALSAAQHRASQQIQQLDNRLRLMERASRLASEPPRSGDDDPDSLLTALLTSLTPGGDLTRHGSVPAQRAALADHVTSVTRQLSAARRLEAALNRSGVPARCCRLEQALRDVQPEVKALARQWEERKAAGRRKQDLLWVEMMTAPAKVEALVVQLERQASGEGDVRASSVAAANNK